MTGSSSLPLRNRNSSPLSGDDSRLTTGSPSEYSVYNKRRLAASMRRHACSFAGSDRSGITADRAQERQYSSPSSLVSQLQASRSLPFRHRRSAGFDSREARRLGPVGHGLAAAHAAVVLEIQRLLAVVAGEKLHDVLTFRPSGRSTIVIYQREVRSRPIGARVTENVLPPPRKSAPPRPDGQEARHY